MNNINKIEAYIQDNMVGRLALTSDFLCAFEYDSQWIRNGYSISPFYLPLKPGLMIAKRNPFNGGFGVFDDSLPDGWGNLVLDRYLTEQGYNPNKLNLLQRLALIGNTGRGSLEYRPDKSLMENQTILDFDRIARDAELLLQEKEKPEDLETLYQRGGSSGGARPKVFTTIDGRHWLVKFRASSDPVNVGVLEYEYSLLAKKCGLIMSETKLFSNTYFATERFDRIQDSKIHTVSAAGLLNANYREPSLDYRSLLQLTQLLTRDMQQVIQMFRLMVFNCFISNRDDHAKNFSFQYVNGNWKLSPVYDLLPSKGFNGYHTTTINDHGDPSLNDVLTLAKEVGITDIQAKSIISDIRTICMETNMLKYDLR